MAKAALWSTTDAEVRKLGEQTGLDTPVVLAVNDGHWLEVTLRRLWCSKSVECPAWGVWSQG